MKSGLPGNLKEIVCIEHKEEIEDERDEGIRYTD